MKTVKPLLLICFLIAGLFPVRAQRYIDNRLYIGIGLARPVINAFTTDNYFKRVRAIDLDVRYKFTEHMAATIEYNYYRERSLRQHNLLVKSDVVKLKMTATPTPDHNFFWEFGVTGTYGNLSYNGYRSAYTSRSENYEMAAIGNIVSMNYQFSRFLIKLEHEFGLLINPPDEIPGHPININSFNPRNIYMDIDLEVYCLILYDADKVLHSGGKRAGRQETEFK